MKFKLATVSTLALGLVWGAGVSAADKPVGITPNMMEATVMHGGKNVKITRDQNNKATVNPAFAKTSRPCPPFCIQPIVLAPGVETLGEVEMIDYLSRMSKGDKSILVVDSRTPDWVQKGTNPGAAAAAVYLSHRVIPLDLSGYGRLLGRCLFNSRRLYAALLTQDLTAESTGV